MRKMILGSLVVGSVIAFTACGGGGGTTDAGGIADADKVAITEANLPNVFDAVGGAFSQSGNVPDFDEIINPDSTTKTAKKSPQIQKIVKTIQDMGVAATQQCDDGGSVTLDGDQTKGTLTFTNCKVSENYGNTGSFEETMNGTVTYETTLTSAHYTLTNFTLSGSESWIGMSNTMESDTWEHKYTNADIKASESETEYSAQISLTMSLKDDDVTAEFSGYTSTFKHTIADNRTEMSVDGFVKTNCMNGWIEIDTTTPIVEVENYTNYEENTCPTQGVITVKGQGGSSTTMTFNSDGSMDFTGAVSKHLASCNEMDSEDGEGACSL